MHFLKTKIKFIKTQKFIKKFYKKGKNNFFVFDDDSEDIAKNIFKQPVAVICDKCNKECISKLYGGKNSPLFKDKHYCFSCLTTGENNPFYGKKHSPQLKEKLSKERKGSWFIGEKNAMYGRNIFEEKTKEEIDIIKKKLSDSCSGEKNGFYGKKHTNETKQNLKELNKLFWENISEEDVNKLSMKLSNAQKRIKELNPGKYKQNKINAAYASHIKQFKNLEPNIIEQIIIKELKLRNIDMEYSVIFCKKQFDFGNKKHKILLEVHGDYWHGNPNYYGDDKIKLNNIQLKNIKNDLVKKEIASKYGFKLFIIWDDEIKQENFKVLDEIKNLIEGIN